MHQMTTEGRERDENEYSTDPGAMQRGERAGGPGMPPPDQLINRELSWLSFNRRVLYEAKNPDNPLLERVKFLSITASNLDEFFMVRYASLCQKAKRGRQDLDPSGMTPQAQMRAVEAGARLLMRDQTDIYTRLLAPEMTKQGLRLWKAGELDEVQRKWTQRTFHKEIAPALSVEIHRKNAPPIPVPGRALHMALLLESGKKRTVLLGTVQVPAGLPRVWWLPGKLGGGAICVEDILRLHVQALLTGYRALACHSFRVTRDEDFVVNNNPDMQNMIAKTRVSLRKRRRGDVVRLEVEAGAPPGLTRLLLETLSVPPEMIYPLEGPLDLRFLSKAFYDAEGLDALRYPPFSGRMPKPLKTQPGVFAALRAGDIFLHHPYDSFGAVLAFIQEAASDPRVLAINITLYRVSGNSPVIWALCRAAEMGKRVTVLLELKARFDEENNIHWAQVLRRSGCDVIYGMPRLKTHSKITLVVRREGTGLRRYMHLGTGNYNDVTAALYTDMGLLTCDEGLGEDAQGFFNMIVGFSREPRMRRLVYAPRMLRTTLAECIQRETQNARAGRPSGITAKMNSLVDPEVIALLYEASGAGVPVRLIVRGVCCLRAGVPGLSESIRVRSIVGRFLEHSRVFCFENAGDTQFFLSSADWMPRNLNRRIELMFPVLDAGAKARIREVLEVQLREDTCAWDMDASSDYQRMPRGRPGQDAQRVLMDCARKG